ncbi:MAG: hypothetical protein JXA99_10645, partial [Candidatus Lokiarchaeota archaeon]|nr:hypothetical protein [Candidatus Lokiarchaeota archaeon]
KNIEDNNEKYNIINKYYKIPSKVILDKYLNNYILKRLLGSQGSYEPVMNVVHLAFLWNIMSIQGIWFPSCGINGINDLLIRYITEHGGRIEKKKEVSKILIEDDRAVGVKTTDKEIYKANWIIADSDYKKIFLNLINPKFLPNSFLDMVKNTPYTGSELCVYLGIDSNKINLSKLRGEHFFYRSKIEPNNSNPIDFQNKDIEICLWSSKSDNLAPKGHISLILRVNMPYHYFKDWREGNFKRNKEYKKQKFELVNKLIKTVEKILPGLSSSIVQLEAATPLTYRDFIGRYKGSIAGWGRDTEKIQFNSKLLIETPIKKLLIVGIYSVIEPFLGGFPVSIYSGYLAANLILERKESK